MNPERNIPEQCINCPFIAQQLHEIDISQSAKERYSDQGFENIDDQRKDQISLLTDRILIDRLKEIQLIQSGQPLIPHEESAVARHLREISDTQTRREVLSRYQELTNGAFDIDATTNAEEVVRATYRLIDTDSLLNILINHDEMATQLDEARTTHTEAIVGAIDANQVVIDHSEDLINRAVKSCKKGPQIKKRYAMFGRKVICCGSRFLYARVTYNEIQDKT